MTTQSDDRLEPPAARDALPHALRRASVWLEAWRRSGQIVLLLDFDGTLAPIVERPEWAAMPADTRAALERVLACAGVRAAVVSGRGMADARERARIPDIAYAGNHGMEIEGPGVRQVHGEAAAARPLLERVRDQVARDVRDIAGALVEDKGLTLSVHSRQVDRDRVEEVRRAVAAAVHGAAGLKVTEGKEVLEIRPDVEWHKGRAVEFLLDWINPAQGAPVLYLGDDVTDEDAFRALRAWRGGAGEGVVIADPPPPHTAAHAYLRDPDEVAGLFRALADQAPS